MRWAEGFIAVDWGTTNRRGYLLDAAGELVATFEDDKGVLSVPSGGFPSAVSELREKLGDRPMLMAGMVGSNRGWIEAPYVSTPAAAQDLVPRLVWAEEASAAIVPGVCHAPDNAADVMRGEEVQVFGAVAGRLVQRDCVLCHPGTHNKWVVVRDGRITAFRTIMTGEMFNLLKGHSILADLLAGKAEPDESFTAGVEHGLTEDDLTAELFSIRARTLLGKAERSAAASYASGLLIGTDLRIGLRFAREEEIGVMGRPELTSLYRAALAVAGRSVNEIDGEAAFLAGARQIAELIQ